METDLSPGASGHSDDEIVLSVRDVSKRFCRDLRRSLWFGIKDIGSELMAKSRQRETLHKTEFWALRDVNFELSRGRAIGLVGRNGSGKTTLMRIISGLIKPTTGYVRTKGRVAPLLALGAAFNPVLTGRENIYVNMATLGLSRKEIDERFDDVVDFSGIEYALEAPVQNYSSGMTARLGFACAVHTYPEVLLIDEVLAVGDIRFIAKCYKKLNSLREAGTSFILVSHNPQAILNLCDTAIYLKSGETVLSGPARDVMERYEEDLHMGAHEGSFDEGVKKVTHDSEAIFQPRGIHTTGANGSVSRTLHAREPGGIVLEFEAKMDLPYVNFLVELLPLEGGDSSTHITGQSVVVFDAEHDEASLKHVGAGKHALRIELPHVGLAPGLYEIHAKAFVLPFQVFEFDGARFTVKAAELRDPSLFYQPREWRLEATR